MHEETGSHDHHDHDRSAVDPIEGMVRVEHEGAHYEFPGEAAPFVGHDGDSVVKLSDSAELLTIHFDKSERPKVMHVHTADLSEEEIVEAGGSILPAKRLD